MREQLHVERNGREGLEQLAQHGRRPFRSALPGRPDMVLGARLAAHRTADLPVEIQPALHDGPAASAGQDELPAGVRFGSEQLQQPNRRGRVEVHHADVQAGLAVGVDGALRRLFGDGGLLEIQPDFVVLSAAEDAVAARLLRLGMAGQTGDALLREPHPRRVESQQHVARGDHDLPSSLRRRRQRQVRRQLPVEQAQADGAVVLARHRNEDLAAGTIRRQPPRVAAGVDDQNPQLRRTCSHVRGIRLAPAGRPAAGAGLPSGSRACCRRCRSVCRRDRRPRSPRERRRAGPARGAGPVAPRKPRPAAHSRP